MAGKDSMIARTWHSMAKQIFNWYLWVRATFMALPGAFKGFDEGNIARIVVNKHFQDEFALSKLSPAALADAKGWMTAIATAGALSYCLSIPGMIVMIATGHFPLLHQLMEDVEDADVNVCMGRSWSQDGEGAHDMGKSGGVEFGHRQGAKGPVGAGMHAPEVWSGVDNVQDELWGRR
ncbi:hypothetical protein JCM10207_003695 [Rhodosporidiobolus poonsookiae]